MRWLAGLTLLFACEGADSDPGLSAWLRVEGAQYASGRLPAEGSGPAIVSLRVPHAQVLPGLRRELLSGSLPPSAQAVLIGVEGDRGHWIVSAGAPAIEEPSLPTFSAELSFAHATPVGPLVLVLSAVDGQGGVGPRQRVTLDAEARARSDQLSIELRWDREVDLDLHVVTPEGRELWPGNINTYASPPPGAAFPDPDAYRDGGVLDLDSNGNCVIDGRREERASFSAPPTPGTYTVRVATASLCEEAVAHWTLEVWLLGQLVQRAQGISQSWDTRQGAGLGDGVLASEFVVP
ncbi:MAG TPA: hypothetical protein VI299_23140 [Polyangiales bacterium]